MLGPGTESGSARLLNTCWASWTDAGIVAVGAGAAHGVDGNDKIAALSIDSGSSTWRAYASESVFATLVAVVEHQMFGFLRVERRNRLLHVWAQRSESVGGVLVNNLPISHS